MNELSAHCGQRKEGVMKKIPLIISIFWILLSGVGGAKDMAIDAPPPAEGQKFSQKVPYQTYTISGGEMVYTQTIGNAPGMGEYRWYNQDFGWTHTFDVSDACILWSDLSIYAWDIDYDAPDGERDLIYCDGQYLGTLYGYDKVWSTTTFTVPTSLLSDRTLNVWLDIDSTHSDYYWAVTIGSSTLRVGYILKTKNLKISATKPIIPRNSGLIGGRVLTRSDLNLYLTQITETCTEEPANGVTLTLQSDRGIIDTITQPGPTNTNGETTARVETRDQLTNSGVSTITSSTPDVITIQPAVITWLPAQFEPRFHTTCYSTELESDYRRSSGYAPARTWRWCRGYTPPSDRYRVLFMDKVRFQGSGVAERGEVIQYEPVQGCYYISSCPLTASGECARVGVTIAVDRNVIPFRGTVDIETIGLRRALDTGSAIRGYHIDVYNGIGKSVCADWQNEDLIVKFLNY